MLWKVINDKIKYKVASLVFWTLTNIRVYNYPLNIRKLV